MTPELQTLLRDTSRSFYLTLRVLPAAVRSQIGLAYLLARATDTVADTELVPVADRLVALRALRERIAGQRRAPLEFPSLIAAQPHAGPPAERRLLERIEAGLSLLNQFSTDDQQDIRAVLATITSGQELDLHRFDGALADCPRALADSVELDDYTYRVAGCVGEFWTRLTRRHCFPRASLDETRFLEDGILFGKGLQLVNILRDLPRDLRNGRCYLPGPSLAGLGLQPRDLLQPENEPRMRGLYDDWVNQAENYLAAGWRYTNTVPHRHVRLRLACAWPILIGARTLAKLRTGRVLDPANRIKVSRAEVKSVFFGTMIRLPFPNYWERQFQNATKTAPQTE